MPNNFNTLGSSNNLRDNQNMVQHISEQINLHQAARLETLKARLRHAFFMEAMRAPKRMVPEQNITFEKQMEILRNPTPKVELDIYDSMRHCETDCCNDEKCVVALCNTMRRYINHFMVCKDLKSNCLYCKQLYQLCTAHGEICNMEHEFAMKFCKNFKKYVMDPKYFDNLFENRKSKIIKKEYVSLYLNTFLRYLNSPKMAVEYNGAA